MLIKLKKIIKHLVFIRNPQLAFKILRGYFKTIILKKNVLRSIELAITYNCQAKCHKCYAANLFDPRRATLSIAQIKEIIEQACRLGIIHINITGGEPLLHKDLLEIIKMGSKNKIIMSVVTNGFLLTEDKIKAMKGAGLNTIQLSLDSADKDTHDSLRGLPGCYERLLESLEWFKKYGINVCFSSVFSPEETSNFSAMKKLLRLAEEKKVFLLICDSAAVGAWNDQQAKMFTCRDRDILLEELMRHPYARHHNMYNFRLKKGCPAGIEKIYITAYGDVTPCDLIHESFGNVLDEPLSRIWARMSDDPRFAKKSYHCIRYLEESGN